VAGTSERDVSRVLTRQRMVNGRFVGWRSAEPLVVFKADNGRGGSGEMPWDLKLSMSFVAFCILESFSKRSGTGFSTGSG
jgi:hypothetical protein